jgi:hypothetical protein
MLCQVETLAWTAVLMVSLATLQHAQVDACIRSCCVPEQRSAAINANPTVLLACMNFREVHARLLLHAT